MNSERWQQLNEVLEAALARTPGHPAAFLDEVCAGDESRRRQPGKCASIKSPISVPMSRSSAIKCYPCREVSLNYCDSLLFHGGDTGSTPVRDAKFLSIVQDPTGYLAV
jgi:hypothetical protein